MKNTTNYMNVARIIGQSVKTKNDLFAVTDRLAGEIMDKIKENPALYAIKRKLVGYGTWRMDLLLNRYAFGEELTRKVADTCGIVTHNEVEDAEKLLEQWGEYINDIITEAAYEEF